ncbi:hypothetical protein [Saccharopolyspora taberi]|uniref:Uncharacterized protein n=1 Tax=Saccharopolyspora taberi TaxID=60895 RepID=A0ABN3V2K9_9PSEU
MTPPLLAGLVDDAGLFPPTALDMAAAVTRHRADRAAGEPMLTHRFLCPASRIGELREELTDIDRIDIGLIADQGVGSLAETCGAIADDERTSLALLEIPVARARSVDEVLKALHALPDPAPAFLEPASPTEVDEVVEAVRRDDTGRTLGAKLRCGGVRAELFPSPAEVAHFLVSCTTGGVPFKATAGLHHAVRHRAEETGFVHHGYLNLLLATAVAAAGGSEDEVRQALEIEDAAELGDRIAGLGAEAVTRTREAMVSYGSCSTSTPVREAQALVSAGKEG